MRLLSVSKLARPHDAVLSHIWPNSPISPRIQGGHHGVPKTGAPSWAAVFLPEATRIPTLGVAPQASLLIDRGRRAR